MNVGLSLQEAAWVAAAVTALVTGIRFLAEFRESRLQRDRELRWKQAEAGKSLNDEMQTDERAWAAMQLLDSENRTFSFEGNTITVAASDVPIALDPATYRDDSKGRFVRDAFDTFFYFMATFDHYARNELILPEDVAYPMEYYVARLAEYEPEVMAYLKKYNLDRARQFLTNNAAWKAAILRSVPLQNGRRRRPN